MPRIARFLTPWSFRRDEQRRRLQELRQRDGDDCRRCRRPLRFDLPAGHDAAPRIEPIGPAAGKPALDNLCLCHTRCNAASGDNTLEVTERVRRKSEAALFAKPRKKARKAA